MCLVCVCMCWSTQQLSQLLKSHSRQHCWQVSRRCKLGDQASSHLYIMLPLTASVNLSNWLIEQCAWTNFNRTLDLKRLVLSSSLSLSVCGWQEEGKLTQQNSYPASLWAIPAIAVANKNARANNWYSTSTTSFVVLNCSLTNWWILQLNHTTNNNSNNNTQYVHHSPLLCKYKNSPTVPAISS